MADSVCIDVTAQIVQSCNVDPIIYHGMPFLGNADGPATKITNSKLSLQINGHVHEALEPR